MKKVLKRKIYNILETYSYNHWLSKANRFFLSILIFLDISSFILETSTQINLKYSLIFQGIAIFTTIVFSVEYILRLWLCTIRERFRHPVWGRVRYALTPLAVVDFMSIFPFYFLLIFHNLAFLNTLRLFRLARILKIGRYSKSVRSLARAVISKKGELLITFSIVFFLLIIASSLMFFVEHNAQPETFSSIPAAMWWGVVTLTTVGYGDIYPVTVLGKLLGAILAFFGIGVFVLPAGIVASGFAEEVKEESNRTKVSVNTELDLELSPSECYQQYRQIREDARLLKYCLQTAKVELSTVESNEEEINSWAIFLYFQAKEHPSTTDNQ